MKYWPFILILFGYISCQTYTEDELEKYAHDVGEVQFDPDLDKADFKRCKKSETVQHYNLNVTYKGEKPAILSHFAQKLNAGILPKENGYISIRFMVNCKGEMGLFRVTCMDFDMKTTKFDKPTVNTLLQLTKEMKGWPFFDQYNYYQVLTFKIENSQITEILP
ncbi:MAG: hypothetical protein AAGK97_09445 [Bacteroidota bacterium]